MKTFEISELPCRAAQFITRENQLVASSDDLRISVYNYNTHERVTSFEAHADYIRGLAVHPALPIVLSASDDMTVKLWNWEQGWANTMVFEGHSHYVMNVMFNPKDSNTFATASLDRTVKVWNLNATTCNFTLSGHGRGLNCVDYFGGGEKPYIVTGADDHVVKVWDYQTKTCVQTLSGHSHNVTAVAFHPTLPLILTGSEDGTIRMWHASTYRLENTINYGLGRVWSIKCDPSSNKIAFGFDEGATMISLGREEPAVSMDSTGKIVVANHTKEVVGMSVKSVSADVEDGEILTLPSRDLGTCEVYPHALHHSPNGRFVSVCGDGEFIIYTSRAWRNKEFGSALEFVWAPDSAEYAIRETSSNFKIFKNFKERLSFKTDFTVSKMFGGNLLGLVTSGSVFFMDWATGGVVRKVDAVPTMIEWSESGEYVAVATSDAFFVLQYHPEVVAAAAAAGTAHPVEGVDGAFDVVFDSVETLTSGIWVGDCFIYTNTVNRLNYCVGSEIVTLAHMDKPMFLLGYLAKDNRLFVMDKSARVASYVLNQAVLEYQTAVLQAEFEIAAELLPAIPPEYHNRVARFLESQGYPEQALAVSSDPEHRFDLAVSLGRLELAREIALEDETDLKWRQLADLSLKSWKFDMAQECMERANNLTGLLLLYTSTADKAGLLDLGARAVAAEKHNIAFAAFLLSGDVDKCIDLLLDTGRPSEAAFMARTYKPSRVSDIVAIWRADLAKVNEAAANALADPMEYENLFPDIRLALEAEAWMAANSSDASSVDYAARIGDLARDIIAEARNGAFSHSVAAAPTHEAPAVEQEEAPAAAPAEPSVMETVVSAVVEAVETVEEVVEDVVDAVVGDAEVQDPVVEDVVEEEDKTEDVVAVENEEDEEVEEEVAAFEDVVEEDGDGDEDALDWGGDDDEGDDDIGDWE